MLLCINTDNFKVQHSNYIYYCSVNYFTIILIISIKVSAR